MKMDRRSFIKMSGAAVVAPSLSDIKVSEQQVLASICRESFYEFVKEFWDTIITEKPIWNWHIKYLCSELQKVAEQVFKRQPKKYDLIINISPGSTKSTICSIMFGAWLWTRMPEAQIIGGSYSGDLSVDLAFKARDVVLSEKYQETFPEVKIRSDQSGKSYYMNNRGGWRKATSTEANITGFHGHFIVIDDPLDPNRALSEVELKSANNWMKDTLPQRVIKADLTPIILIMQRLHQNDPSANMIERIKEEQRISKRSGDEDAKLKLRHICLPATLTNKVRPRKLRKKYKKGLMDPIRCPQETLNTKKVLGDYIYSGQFLQWPVPLGGGMFKIDRILIDTPPARWKRRIRFWDKAGTQGGAGAFTVGLLMGVDRKDRYWILDVKRGRWSTEEREARIKQTAIMDGRDIIIGIEQEPGSGGKESAENTVRNLAGYSVKIDKPSGSQSSKELRADPLSTQVNACNVLMKKAPWNQELLNEYEFFPASTYKDQVDAGSGAFNWLAKGQGTVGAFLRAG